MRIPAQDPATAAAEPIIKRREVRFVALHPDPDQAETASRLLADSTSVIAVERKAENVLRVSYDLRQVTLAEIDGALRELGFHLEDTLLCKLKRAICYYAEENERSALGASSVKAQWAEPNDPRDVFVRNYRQQRHGCRDERSRFWREYH